LRIIAQWNTPAGAMVKVVNKDGKIDTADLSDTSNPKESSDWVYTNKGVKSWKKINPSKFRRLFLFISLLALQINSIFLIMVLVNLSCVKIIAERRYWVIFQRVKQITLNLLFRYDYDKTFVEISQGKN